MYKFVLVVFSYTEGFTETRALQVREQSFVLRTVLFNFVFVSIDVDVGFAFEWGSCRLPRLPRSAEPADQLLRQQERLLQLQKLLPEIRHDSAIFAVPVPNKVLTF
jgi:hypothetical protein